MSENVLVLLCIPFTVHTRISSNGKYRFHCTHKDWQDNVTPVYLLGSSQPVPLIYYSIMYYHEERNVGKTATVPSSSHSIFHHGLLACACRPGSMRQHSFFALSFGLGAKPTTLKLWGKGENRWLLSVSKIQT